MKPNKIDKIKNLEMANMPSDVMDIALQLQRDQQSQSGKHDQALGRGSSGDQTAREIAAKENADAVRNILQIQNKDEWIKQVMGLVAEMDRANFEPGDWARMLENGALAGMAELTTELLSMEFTISLKIGTDLPIDKARKKNDMLELADRLGPFAMARQLLEVYELDAKEVEEILDRLDGYRDYEAFMAEQERLQAEQEAQQGQSTEQTQTSVV